MSRRAPIANDRAAQNQNTIKQLLKLEGNKVCADCKRNKHPRWASWNLGVFVCIRCSGIHRGMGTHVSRIKSVDLDSWTDEQLQSVLRWGNSRANKYWEAKLAAGHVPSEAKMENFIRTKYESKRWAMEGGMPDPATLDVEGDDNVPLSLVQEKAKIERSASQRISSAPQQPQPLRQAAPTVDLFGDDIPAAPIRPSTTDTPNSRPVAKASAPAPAKPSKPGESLLGLDFFGNSQPSARPSSASSNPAGMTSSSRPDLKQSILSLYANTPKPQQAPMHDRQPSFGAPAQQNSFGGLTDAFSGLSFPSTNTAKPPPLQPAPPAPHTKSDFAAFSAFSPTVTMKSPPAAPQMASPPPLAGGGFFDSAPPKPIPQPKAPSAPMRAPSNGLNFNFTQATAAPAKAAPPVLSNDLFASVEFSGFASASPASPVAPPPPPPPTKVSSPLPSAPSANTYSAFNLSAPSSEPKPSAPAPKPPPMMSNNSSALFDPWSSGNENTWSAPEPAPPPKPAAPTVDIGKPPTKITPNDIAGEWGSPITASKNAPTVAPDEDFGGWTSATQTPATGPGTTKSSGGGLGTASDPFDNPWG